MHCIVMMLRAGFQNRVLREYEPVASGSVAWLPRKKDGGSSGY